MKLDPRENYFFYGFWSQSVKYCPHENFTIIYMVSLSLHTPGYGHQSSHSLSPEERVVGLALSQPAAQRGAHRCSGDSSAAGEIPSLVRFVT